MVFFKDQIYLIGLTLETERLIFSSCPSAFFSPHLLKGERRRNFCASVHTGKVSILAIIIIAFISDDKIHIIYNIKYY